MSRLNDLLNSIVRPKSELEKEMDGTSEIENRKKGISWGMVILVFGVVWALFELVRAIMFFF